MSVATESISLASEEAPQLSSDSLKQVNAKITQINKWKKQGNVIQLLEKQFLHITRFDGKKYSFWASLLLLDQNPKRKLLVNWKWLLASAIAAALTAGTYFAVEKMGLSTQYPYAISAPIALGTIALITLVAFFYTIQNSMVFYSRKTQIPLFEIFNNKPNKAEFKRFMEIVAMVMAKEQKSCQLSADKLLAAELEQIRRLKEAKLVNEQDYLKARKVLLSGH